MRSSPKHLVPLLALFALAACSESVSPPPPTLMDGDMPDGFMLPTGDTDGDGLCDDSEISRGTDPLVSDTDGDGFTDFVEVMFGTDPMLSSSPDRDTVFLLRENPESSVQIPISRRISGGGEDYVGAFESLGRPDLAGATAADFYAGSVALFADPAENAAIVDGDAETIFGVVGRTLLGYEVRMAFGSNLPRSCIRAYQFRYNIKRSDGRLVGLERRLVVVLPTGDRLDSGEWCAPVGSCI